eukprot:comp18909_c2_seq1/m.21054 comp18909_c2_seq1/g.21054  ORF comp18909_c2_seq1/g.21054 comp18909_c2_seq1/m.21054 type:complete len:229 (-) comp18909_c2_seq1:421-1107(-)
MRSLFLLGCLAFAGFMPQQAAAKDSMLTFELYASREECFFEDAKHGVRVEIDWEVIAGSTEANNDVSIQMWDANGQEVNIPRGGSNFFEHEARADGPVKVCFRNLNSFNTLWVYFEIGVDRANDDDDDFGDIGKVVDADMLKAQQQTQESLDKLKKTALSVHQKLSNAIRTQNYLRYREARHRNTAESNCDRVMYWSVGSCAVMIAVSIVQVYFIQHFFADPKGRINY